MAKIDVGVIVKCPSCEWRILDKITPTTGTVRLKCPRCGKLVVVDLSLRKDLKFRLTKSAS